MMISVEQSVECLTEETEVLGENLLQCHFVHHESHITSPVLKPGSSRREAGDISYIKSALLFVSVYVIADFFGIPMWRRVAITSP
jgi:hypothetical protein